MIEKLARSWELVKASAAVLKADKELLLLPVLSGAASLALLACFAALSVGGGWVDLAARREYAVLNESFYLLLFGFYVVQYFIVIFFNTALVGAALTRLDGGDPTLGGALEAAAGRIGPILGYALVSATIGIILRAIAERLGIIGRIIEGFVGVAWTVATFLVVPVLVVEGVGPFKAIERSAALLRQTWGENLIGNGGVSVVIGLFAMLIGFFGFAFGAVLVANGQAAGFVILALAFIAFLALIVVGAALSGVYSAALYYYATLGKPKNFDASVIRFAFTPKS